MTHVLIAADLFTTGFIFIVVVIVFMLIATASRGQIIPWRRRYRRRGFWYTDQQNDQMFGHNGLLDDVYEMGKETFSDTDTDLSIYKSHDNTNHATHTASSGSILGLDGGTATGGLDNSSGFGSLGEAAAEYFYPDNSSGGFTDFGDSSGGFTGISDSSGGNSDHSDWNRGGGLGDSSSFGEVVAASTTTVAAEVTKTDSTAGSQMHLRRAADLASLP